MKRYQRLIYLVGAVVALGSSACGSKDSKSAASTNKVVGVEDVSSNVKPSKDTDPELQRVSIPADQSAPIPLDPKVQHGKLDNGLSYYIRPNRMPEQRAEFWLSIDVGSFHEDEDQRGLAHFLEHMAFNGTTSFPKTELVAKLESLGVEFGPHLNASTSFDETIYKLRLPTDKPETVALGIQILSEWAGGITLDPDEFEKERGVVLAEKRSRDGAQMRLVQALISDVFEGTRYANRLPIGLPKVLKEAPLSAIKRFYKDWYHPANMAVYVVGDIDPAEIERQIKESFGSMKAQEKPRIAPKRKQPSNTSFKFLTLQDKELPVTAVALGRLREVSKRVGLAGIRPQFVDIMALLMLSKRLEEAQKRGQARYLMAAGSPAPLLRESEALALFAMVDPKEVEGGLEDLLNEVERASRYGFTASELNRANEEIHAMIKSRAKEDAAGKEPSSALVQELTRFHLAGEDMGGRAMELAIIEHFAKTVTTEEVSAALKGFVAPQGLIAMSIGSAAKDVLNEAKVRSMLAELRTKQLVAYADEPSTTELMTTQPSPGTLIEEKHHKAADVHEWKLGNGATVVLKETDFKSDQILFVATSAGGTSVVGDAKRLPAIVRAAQVVAQGGVGTMDSVTLQRALAGRVVSMSPYIGRYDEGLEGSASPADLEAMLQLAHLYFVAPRRDEQAFSLFKRNTVTSLEQVENSPETRFARSLWPSIANKNPRRPVWTKQAAQKLDLDASMAFYKDRMSNAGDFRFFLVGNFKRAEVKDLVLRYLGSLPDAGRREELRSHPWPTHKARKLVKKKDGSQKRASISMFFDTPRSETMPSITERLAWDLFASAVQMHYLAIFREELGESYSVSMRSSFRNNWSHAIATLSLQCAPERAKIVQKRAEQELKGIALEGISEEYFLKAKEALVKGHEVDLKRNGFWLGRLDRAYFNGATPDQLMERGAAIAALSREDVNKVAGKYLDAKRPIIGLHLPSK